MLKSKHIDFVETNAFPILCRMKVDLTKYIEEHLFSFDNAYSELADNNQIYQECVLPLVSETFKGAKTTCFAYG